MRRYLALAATAAVTALGGVAVVATPASAATVPGQPVIVIAGSAEAAAQAVTAAGGMVRTELPIVHGVAATVPARGLPALAAAGVSVTPDGSGHLQSLDPDLGYDPAADAGALPWIAGMLHADQAWADGITGKGVDVALIDSGVAAVPGLTSGNVVDGPDLSFESQHADVAHRDTFGHGTHLASIIAGRDAAGTAADYAAAGFTGIAPDARVVSVKVATANGATDVSQVIAAIGWVTAHAHDNGLNIRVLNLSYGTDSTQPYQLDPLAYAVEQAWKQGIVVVVAAGNDGTNRAELADPASDPYVIAVGADDPNGTATVTDDTVPAFAQRGTAARRVDVIAPGVHVLGLRDPNGLVDQENPAGRVGTRFIRGSGTSQATAVASAVAALVVQKFPAATPDQVKHLLRDSATALPAAPDLWEGLGVLDAAAAIAGNPAAAPVQTHAASTGTGTLEGARGTSHVAVEDSVLTGERDIFGRDWSATAAWDGGSFNGSVWTGTGFADGSWSVAPWDGTDWSSRTWVSRTWVSRTWVGDSWDSRTWVDSDWSSRTWVSRTWVDDSWSSRTWVGGNWSSASWS